MKKNIFKIISIFVILILIANTNIILAVSQSDIDSKKNEKNEISNKIDEAKSDLKEVQTEKSETVKQIEAISSQIDTYENQIEEMDAKISDLNNKISESEKKINEKQESYDKNQKLLEERLVTTYEAGDTSYLDVLLSSENLTDLISNYYLVSELATYDAELLEKIQNEKEEIQKTKESLEVNKQEVTTTKASKQKVSTQLQQSKKEKSETVAKLSESEKEIQEKIDALNADNARINNELKVAEAKYQAQLEELKKQQESNTGKPSNGTSGSSSGGSYNAGGSGYLQRPVKSGTITTTMYYSSGRYHGALDYGVPSGTTVYAAADGVVYMTGYAAGSYGNYVVIQHTNGLRTWYAHGNGIFYVSAGQTVSKGQPIMQSGNSGNSSGPHLHFEVRVSPYSWNSSGNDSRRDPRNYM